MKIIYETFVITKNFRFVFALEGKGKQERRKLFKKYKLGARKALQITESHKAKASELLSFLGSLQIKTIKGEADDAIAAYVATLDPTDTVVIVTEDKDLWQLVKDPYRRVLSVRRGCITESEVIQNLHGIKPSEILLYKALCGDSSDNLPRVKGLRSQTAIRLIHREKTLKKLLRAVKDLDEVSWVTDRERSSLEVCKDQVRLNYRLAKLRAELPVRTKLVGAKPKKLRKFLLTQKIFRFDRADLRLVTGKTDAL